MIVSRIDPEARSTHAAAKGFRALCEGDTELARQKYTEAGEILERGSKHDLPAADKHLLRFLAASQYYHGGEYQRAKALVAKVNAGHLRPGHRGTLNQLRKDVEERADTNYPQRIRDAVFAAWKQERWDAAIQLFQHHPYVVERWMLAWLRADLCCSSGRLKAAALFSADAIRFSDHHPTPIVLRAGMPLVLESRGPDGDSLAFAELVLDHSPTPLDWLTASVVLFPLFKEGDPAAGRELLSRFQRARADFPTLPQRVASDSDVLRWMAHGYFVAALTTDRMGDRPAALRLVAEAEALAAPGPYSDIFRRLRADTGDWFPQQLAFASPSVLLAQRDTRLRNYESALRSAA